MNRREKKVAEQLKSSGWTVLRGGWPDFLCYRDREVLAVEVKPPGESVPDHQLHMHNALRQFGIPVTVERIGKTIQGQKRLIGFRLPMQAAATIQSLAKQEHRNHNNMISTLVLEALKARSNHVNPGN